MPNGRGSCHLRPQPRRVGRLLQSSPGGPKVSNLQEYRHLPHLIRPVLHISVSCCVHILHMHLCYVTYYVRVLSSIWWDSAIIANNCCDFSVRLWVMWLTVSLSVTSGGSASDIFSHPHGVCQLGS